MVDVALLATSEDKYAFVEVELVVVLFVAFKFVFVKFVAKAFVVVAFVVVLFVTFKPKMVARVELKVLIVPVTALNIEA